MTLPMMAQDRANHTLYGAAIALVVQTVAATLALHFGIDTGLRPKDIGLAVSAAFGIGKEAVDAMLNYRATGNWRTGPHGVDAGDAFATLSGGMLVWGSSP